MFVFRSIVIIHFKYNCIVSFDIKQFVLHKLLWNWSLNNQIWNVHFQHTFWGSTQRNVCNVTAQKLEPEASIPVCCCSRHSSRGAAELSCVTAWLWEDDTENEDLFLRSRPLFAVSGLVLLGVKLKQTSPWGCAEAGREPLCQDWGAFLCRRPQESTARGLRARLWGALLEVAVLGCCAALKAAAAARPWAVVLQCAPSLCLRALACPSSAAWSSEPIWLLETIFKTSWSGHSRGNCFLTGNRLLRLVISWF